MDIQYILRVIDFETTGIPKEGKEHSVVEAAYVDVDAATKERKNSFQTLVAPTTPMDIEALATHHISQQEALTGITWGKAQQELQAKYENQELIYVAHNADFERKFFDPTGAKWIDTYKVALKLHPDAPRHTNQVLKYYLGIADREHHHPPHRALPDCEVTAEVLQVLGQICTFNEMIHISKQPPYFTRLTFGKHRGERYEDVPTNYLRWIVGQKDMDEGVIAAARRALENG